MRKFLSIIIILFAVGVVLPSCCARRIAGNTQARHTDSITVITRTETVRDTVVHIAPDSAMVKALLECDSIGRIRMARLVEYEAGERMRPPRLDITDNILTASTEVDSMAIYLTLRDRLEQEKTTVTDTRNTETIIEVNRPTAWQRICCWTVSLAIGCAILFGGWKLFNIIRK